MPRDFTALFDRTLYGLDTSVIPDAVRAFEQLHVKHEPLKLIAPQFETPLPPLQPAVRVWDAECHACVIDACLVAWNSGGQHLGAKRRPDGGRGKQGLRGKPEREV